MLLSHLIPCRGHWIVAAAPGDLAKTVIKKSVPVPLRQNGTARHDDRSCVSVVAQALWQFIVGLASCDRHRLNLWPVR